MHKISVYAYVSLFLPVSVCLPVSLCLCALCSMQRIVVFLIFQCHERIILKTHRKYNKGERKKNAHQKLPITLQNEWSNHSHQVVFFSFYFCVFFFYGQFAPTESELFFFFLSRRLPCRYCDRTTTTRQKKITLFSIELHCKRWLFHSDESIHRSKIFLFAKSNIL